MRRPKDTSVATPKSATCVTDWSEGAGYELYLNNPHDIRSSDYLTELRIPIEGA